MKTVRRLGLIGIWALTMALPQSAWAANYPLELTNIGPVGVNGMTANNRIFRAYPGLVYNIRPALIGGAYPFQFSLTNAPADMTINPQTGEINWTNPQSNATPTLTVTDAEGTVVNATWTITVSTSGFRFVDAVNGRNASNNGCSSACGTGTFANPWRNLMDLYLNDAATDITYFRSGTYFANVIPVANRINAGGVWERIVFSDDPSSGSPGSVIWLGYPNETPIIDFACATCTEGLLIRHNGQSVYLDGLEGRNARLIAFQFEPDGTTFRGGTYRRLNMHDLGPGIDGTNSAFIMTLSSYPLVSYGMVIQDSTFSSVTGEAVTIKVYSQIKSLIENTVHQNASVALELKADVRQFTVRANSFSNISTVAIGGNMHGCVQCAGGADQQTTGGEIIFNLSRATGSGIALDLNQDGQALEVFVQRNTLVGRVQLRNTDAADGPFRLTRNVIVSSDSGTPAGSHVHHVNVTAPSRLVLTENLAGFPADNIVDAGGNLTAAYQQFVGVRGHQLIGLPNTVTGLRVTPPED